MSAGWYNRPEYEVAADAVWALIEVGLIRRSPQTIAEAAAAAKVTIADLRDASFRSETGRAKPPLRSGPIELQNGSAKLAKVADDEERRRYLKDTFALPDGRRVAWATATAEEHLQRARWRRKLAGQHIADAERHERAAAEIEAAGVSCLADFTDGRAA